MVDTKNINRKAKNLRLPKETKIETALINLVLSYGGICPKWVSPNNASAPDRICLFPGGLVWFVETKRPGSKPTKLQLFTHAKLRELGFNVSVIWNKEQLKQFENDIQAT